MLLGNYNVFNCNPGHAVGGVTDPTYWSKSGSAQMFYYGDSAVSGQTEKAHFPGRFVLAPKAGGLTSRRSATFTITPAAAIAGGLPGSGSATITFSPTATLISVASGSGSATVTFSTSALIGALAGVSGSTTVTLSPAGTILGVGYMSGLSTNETEFSEAALDRAVWTALATDYNDAGTMGEKMNDAGSGGDPWATVVPGSYTAGTAGWLMGKLLTVGKFLGLK